MSKLEKSLIIIRSLPASLKLRSKKESTRLSTRHLTGWVMRIIRGATSTISYRKASRSCQTFLSVWTWTARLRSRCEDCNIWMASRKRNITRRKMLWCASLHRKRQSSSTRSKRKTRVHLCKRWQCRRRRRRSWRERRSNLVANQKMVITLTAALENLRAAWVGTTLRVSRRILLQWTVLWAGGAPAQAPVVSPAQSSV